MPGIAQRYTAGMRRPCDPAFWAPKLGQNMCVSTDELVNPRAVANELAIINDPATAKEQPVLVEFVSQLHAASSASDLFALHTKLLARYLARQRLRDELRLDKSKVKSEIGELAAKTPKPIDDLRARQEELKRLKTAERVQVALAAHIRAIADGVVWKALGYDRAAITVLGRGTRVDRLADDGVGLQAELDKLAELSGPEGTVTIHNDLATILRHGDLTTIDPGRRSVEIREVKATARPGPNAPQSVRLSEAIKLINDGAALDPGSGRIERLRRLAIKSRTFLGDLAEVIQESRGSGYAQRVLGSMQHLTVIDYQAWAGRETELEAHDVRVRRDLGWGPEHKTFEWLASLRRMRDRKISFGSLAPLPIFPLDPVAIADLMVGRLEMRTMLRGDVFERAFADSGIKALVEFGDARNDVFVKLERGSVTLMIPPFLREQMLFELLTSETAIETIVATLDLLAVDAHVQQGLLPAIDETGVWA
jgi:hypothetical protein